MIEKSRHILLRHRQQHAVPLLDKLGEDLQIAVVGLAGERTQPFFHAQIGLVFLQQRQIARSLHGFDYPRSGVLWRPPRAAPNLVHHEPTSTTALGAPLIATAPFQRPAADGFSPAQRRITLKWGHWQALRSTQVCAGGAW